MERRGRRDREYVTITSFTTAHKKDALIKDVESTTVEEFPMIRFATVEVNDKLAEWIQNTLG